MPQEAQESKAPERPASLDDLGFDKQGMVKWLDPKFLIVAGLEVLVSGLFGRYADKREIEGAFPIEPPLDEESRMQVRTEYPPYTDDFYRDEGGALWIDFASDVGEGFDATFTVASLLATEKLTLTWEGEAHETKRGRILVLGGDQVYPSASWDAYRDRFVGPYTAALPFIAQEKDAPHLYALPGNHDWYDGLTSFVRLFCQGGWIGGWQTRQRRSYFALRLSQRWWLWGTDIQFDTYMDGPQLDFFRRASEKLGDDHRVILATAKPSWVTAPSHGKRRLMGMSSWETLSYLEEKVIAPTGAEVVVTLTGDKHHYARYWRREPGGPRERITAGGGGAHTSATHGLKDTIRLLPHGSDQALEYERGEISPTRAESRRMRTAIFVRVYRFFWLAALIGAIYALIAVSLADGIKDQDTGLAASLDDHSWLRLLWDAATQWSVGSVLLLGVGLFAFTDASPGRGLSNRVKKPLLGVSHTAAHLVPVVALTLLGLELFDYGSAAKTGLALGWLVAVAVFVFGLLWGPLVFASYLWLANENNAEQHSTELYGGLQSTEYKNFLRLRLDNRDRLTIYPVGIRRCPRWELAGVGASDTDPWFTTAVDDIEPKPELLERPIEPPLVCDGGPD